MPATLLRWPESRDDWRLSPPAAAAATGLALWMVAALGHAIGLAPVWALAAVGAAGVGALLALHGRELSRLSLTLRIGLWAGAGVWLWLALAGSPWRLGMLASLIIVTVAAALAAPALDRRDTRIKTTATAQAATQAAVDAHDQEGAQWQTWLREAGADKATVLSLEQWDPTTIGGRQVVPGLTLDVDTGGQPVEQLTAVTGKLAARAGLPPGAGAEVVPGINQRRGLIYVAQVDTLADDLPWEHGPRSSVNNDMTIGRFRNSFPTEIGVRQRKILICGPPRTGKSTALHGLIGRALEQDDHLIMGIDLAGGDLFRPWLTPWLEGRAERPAIDWVAADVETGIAMAEAVLAMGRWRKSATVQARRDADSTLIPLGPHMPRITIVTDEGETTAGGAADQRGQYLGHLLQTINKELGNPGCDAWFCALRPIGASLGNTDLRVHSAVRIQTGGGLEEASHMFGHAQGLQAADTARQGRLWVQVDEGQPRPYVGPDLVPSVIDEIAVRTDEWRPVLDQGTARAGGDAYARRWDPDRVAWLLNDPTSTGTPASAAVTPAGGPEGGGESMGDAIARLQRSADAVRAGLEAREAVAPEPAGPADDDLAKLAGILAATEERESAAVRLARAGDRRGAALALLLDHDQTGAGASTLHPRLVATIAAAGDTTAPTSRSTLAEWLVGWWHARMVWRRQGREGIYVHGELPRPADATDPPSNSGE